MEHLFDSIKTEVGDLEEIIMSSDLNQMSSTELKELCSCSAELITLYEKNEKELDSMFGKELGAELERLKFCAVIVKRILPLAEKVEDELDSINDDFPEVIDDLKAAIDVDLSGDKGSTGYTRQSGQGPVEVY